MKHILIVLLNKFVAPFPVFVGFGIRNWKASPWVGAMPWPELGLCGPDRSWNMNNQNVTKIGSVPKTFYDCGFFSSFLERREGVQRQGGESFPALSTCGDTIP
jgi:hypothetical protein